MSRLQPPCLLLGMFLVSLCQGQTAKVPQASSVEVQGDTFVQTIDAIKRSVIPVVCLVKNPDGSVRPSFIVGSAFFISRQGDFMTAAHVINDTKPGPGRRPCPLPAIYMPKNGRWPAAGVNADMQWFGFPVESCSISNSDIDLAKCRTQTNLEQSKEISAPPVPVTFETSLPDDGTEVAFTGFPLNIPLPRTARGSVAGYGSADNVQAFELVMDKTSWPGASGSPVYLANGHVVGIVLARGKNEAAGLAFARTSNIIGEFLKGK